MEFPRSDVSAEEESMILREGSSGPLNPQETLRVPCKSPVYIPPEAPPKNHKELL